MNKKLAYPLVGAALILTVGLLTHFSGRQKLEWRPMPKEAYPVKDDSSDMVSSQIAARGVTDPAVLKAMREVPRQEFVPGALKGAAFSDNPLPIGSGQTISQPYIVAFMTEALELKPGEKVLEIGTGSGYQAAVLSSLGVDVFSIEIVCELERTARERLDRLGYGSVRTKCADGYNGWPEEAPFDAIILTAAPAQLPAPLIAQLADGGRLIAPVGGKEFQELVRIRRKGGSLSRESLIPVAFVPMTGKAGKSE